MGSSLEQQEDPARLTVLFLVRGWPQIFTETGNSPVLCLHLPWPCAVGQGRASSASLKHSCLTLPRI